MIRGLPREQTEHARFWTVDDLPKQEATAYGLIAKQVVRRIIDTNDADAKVLLGLLPDMLLTDRQLTRNGRRIFLERCHQLVALRNVEELVNNCFEFERAFCLNARNCC